MKITLILGYPASGKTTIAKKLLKGGDVRLNRDSEGKNTKISALLPKLDAALKEGKDVVLDNLFPTRESRKPFIEIAKLYNAHVECFVMGTSIEDAQVNYCTRTIHKYGNILSPEQINGHDDPGVLPPAALFSYRSQYQPPEKSESIDHIEEVKFVRERGPEYKNGAIILDYDGTLRTLNSSVKDDTRQYPIEPKEIKILPNRKAKLSKLVALEGIRLLGASNQSGIAKKILSDKNAHDCFKETNRMLGDVRLIDYSFCRHSVPPIKCWCRKPMPGMGVEFIEKYKLNPAKCTMVGDLTSDKTFAMRCGFKFVHADKFFATTDLLL